MSKIRIGDMVQDRNGKPRRTITLSEALAWLGDGIWDLRHDGRGWWVQDDDGHRYEISTTPLKAIIAARRSLKAAVSMFMLIKKTNADIKHGGTVRSLVAYAVHWKYTPDDVNLYEIINGEPVTIGPDAYSECEMAEEITDLAPPFVTVSGGLTEMWINTRLSNLLPGEWDRDTPVYRVVNGRIVEVPRSEYTRMVTKGPRRWKVMP